MTTISLGNSCKFATSLTLIAGLLGGCTSYQPTEGPPNDGEQSSSMAAASPVTPSAAPASAGQMVAASAAPLLPPTSTPTETAARTPTATTPKAVMTTLPPPPASSGFIDKSDTGSYLATPEYQEAAQYQEALERYLTDPFIVASYLATEKLIENSQVDVAGYSKLVIAPFGDLDRSERSTLLGKMISGQIASRFTQLGYQVMEADSSVRSVSQRYPASGYATGREPADLATRYNARAVIVGHYAISQDRIFVNARLIDTAVNNRVMSAYDYALPLDKTTLALVTGCLKQGQWICRLP
jgi:TolB-like protein